MPKVSVDNVTVENNTKEAMQDLIDNIEFLLERGLDSDNLLNYDNKKTSISEGKVAGLVNKDTGFGGMKALLNRPIYSFNKTRPFFNPNNETDNVGNLDRGIVYDYLKLLNEASRPFVYTVKEVFNINRDIKEPQQQQQFGLGDLLTAVPKAITGIVGGVASSIFGSSSDVDTKIYVNPSQREYLSRIISIKKTPSQRLMPVDKIEKTYGLSLIRPINLSFNQETNLSLSDYDYDDRPKLKIESIEETPEEVLIEVNYTIPPVDDGKFLVCSIIIDVFMEDLL